jgi:hypothetical protein
VDDEDVRTETQKEWANWPAHGYRKLYQPRSMLWFGGIFCTLFGVFLVVIFWLASTGRMPRNTEGRLSRPSATSR